MRQGERGRWSGRATVRASAVGVAVLGLALAGAAPSTQKVGKEGGDLALVLRSRVESPGLGGAFRVVESPERWSPAKTAVIVCDMWDLHHCLNATRRGAELAPRMNGLVESLRARGVTVIHAPSSCMGAYRDHPARVRALSTPKSRNLPTEIGQWCKQIPAEEAASYPVDQREGGEDDDPAEHDRWQARLAALGRNPRAPWKAQTDAIRIDADTDYITDDGREVWSVLEARGVDNVILMGVHLNMCVLGRPFGLRQMARNGKRVALVRDMTDTMYDPRKAPFVSHFTGTDRMVEHVERYVCPTFTSDQVVGGKPFRFPGDTRPHAVFVVAEDEYKTETTLPRFAAAYLGNDFRVSFAFDTATDKEDVPGLSMLDDADLAIISVRRRLLPTNQLAALRRYVKSGKPLVGIRTASHAFSARGNAPAPAGHDAWPEFDAEVLGGHYTGHHGPGPDVTLSAVGVDQAGTHPLLAGMFKSGEFMMGSPSKATTFSRVFVGHGSLYKVSPLASSCTTLLTGKIPGEPAEPVLWTNLSAAGGRVVYTSLGHADDFKQPDFNRLLRNALLWAVEREVSATLEKSQSGSIAFPK